jgi:hypothetical protein
MLKMTLTEAGGHATYRVERDGQYLGLVFKHGAFRWTHSMLNHGMPGAASPERAAIDLRDTIDRVPASVLAVTHPHIAR